MKIRIDRKKVLGDYQIQEEDFKPDFKFTDDLKKAFLDQLKKLSKPVSKCLLCDEEIPGTEKGVCTDCKRVFAAFKSILVEEKACESK